MDLQSGAVMHNNNAVTNMGGAIYANASNINIAANSAVYNNTAAAAGDDLYLNNGSIFTLPNAKAMSGDRILSSDNFPITGWYHDGYKWNAAANNGQGDFEQNSFPYTRSGKAKENYRAFFPPCCCCKTDTNGPNSNLSIISSRNVGQNITEP